MSKFEIGVCEKTASTVGPLRGLSLEHTLKFSGEDIR